LPAIYAGFAGLATPIVSGWVLHWIATTHERRQELRKLFLEIGQQVAEFRGAWSSHVLADVAGTDASEAFEQGANGPHAEMLFSEAQDASRNARETNEAERRASAYLSTSCHSLTLLLGNPSKTLQDLIRELCSAGENFSPPRDLNELPRIENRMHAKLTDKIHFEMKRLWDAQSRSVLGRLAIGVAWAWNRTRNRVQQQFSRK